MTKRRLRRTYRRFRAPVAAALGLFLVACVSEVETHPVVVDRSPPEVTGEPVIRVLLHENVKQLKVACPGPVRIVPSSGDPLFPDKLDETLVVVDEATLGMKLGDKPFFGTQELRLVPSPGANLKVEGKTYKGELVLKVDKGVFLKAIDHVGAEDYVAGVLGGEMSLKWPDAALKAQSVAARTYGVFHWKRSKLRDFDVYADTRSQVYTGVGPERAVKIIAATQGKILTYHGSVFEAFFYSSCAGETASGEWIFGPSGALPPLSGAKCGYCVGNPNASWERKVTQAELAKALASQGVTGRIEKVETVPWPRGGYVKEVKVRFAGGEVAIAGTKFRFAFQPPLKSSSFEVATDPTGETLVVAGKGWGHGVGLCQWGAKGCADTGMDEDRILLHYYPGAEVSKLY